jgi:Zn-dependent protease with chaperone function
MLRSPNEFPLFVIGVAISVMVWLVSAVTIVGLLYGAVSLVFIFIAHALFLAGVKGNGARISERQRPEVHARVQSAAEKLGMKRVPDVYLVQSHGVLNALATRLLSRRFVIIHSSLADTCEDPRQPDLVIGNEFGHLAMGHLSWNASLTPYRLIPWLKSACSRAYEYTGDRSGLAVVGELEASVRGLAVLAAKGRRATLVDLAAFVEQGLETGSFWMSVLERVSRQPHLRKRAAALRECSQPGTMSPLKRNGFAYVLASLFGFAAGPAGSAKRIDGAHGRRRRGRVDRDLWCPEALRACWRRHAEYFVVPNWDGRGR